MHMHAGLYTVGMFPVVIKTELHADTILICCKDVHTCAATHSSIQCKHKAICIIIVEPV